MRYYVMFLNDEDIDEGTIGGAEAYETDNLREAIRVAKRLTEAGHPCQVEDGEAFCEVMWKPEEEE